MFRKYYRVAIGMLLAVFMVFGGAISPLSGVNVYAAGVSVYIDGVNGNDSNDGSSEGKAVKSWDKARALLGTQEGTIFVTGTVTAKDDISTQASGKQSVKRADGFTGVMFEVPSGATVYFFNIDVDGEDKHIDAEIIKPNQNTTLNFLKGAVFHDVGYYAGSQVSPSDTVGGLVCSLDKNMTILIDGAEFRNNDGKGIFFTPLRETSSGSSNGWGVPNVYVTMKAGIVDSNKGYFYYNENDGESNQVRIYNALITNNDASSTPTKYTSYTNRTGIIYVCDAGIMRLRSLDGAAIFDNKTYDIMALTDPWETISEASEIVFQGTSTSDLNHTMLGGGNPQWGSPIDAGNGYFGYKSNPSSADRGKGAEAATSFFTNNESALIDMNGYLTFGRYSSETPPETPIPDEPETPTEPETPEEPEDPTPDEPTEPETPTEPEDPTPDEPTQPTSKIKLTTKVKNQYISPAKDQTIIDIVTAKGLEEGKEYTLKGEIRKADGSENGTVISSSNAPCPITSDVDQFQAEMTFSKIDASSLKAGDKLVVFEYLYEGDDEATKDFKPGDDNEIAKHANINSAAQTTMIVDGQIKISKKADVEIVEAGKDVPYTITVTNERNVPAVVDVVDTPEAGLIYKEADNDASYDSDEKTVIWEDLEVPANGTITLSIVFTVSEDASGKLKNRAKVNEPDNPGNVLGINEDDDDVKVLGVYDEENDDNPKNKAKTKGANTGDDAPMAGAILALLAAAGAFEVMRRRRMN